MGQNNTLETAYDALKGQFKKVNQILKDTNMKLSTKAGELDVLIYYLNSILSHISQGLLFINLDGYVITCNEAAEEMLGIDSSKISFQLFSEHFLDSVFGFSMKRALAEKKAPHKIFVNFNTPKGKLREFEIDTTFILKKDAEHWLFDNPMETLQGIIILMRDITEVHRLQILASRNDRMKALGEMAAMVAHEIRNPLGGIKGYASLLQRDLQQQPQLQQFATCIVEGTDALNRLVTNVLNYARPIQAHVESVDIITLVREISQHLLADESLDSNILIKIEPSFESLNAPVDTQLFKSALLNLIVNSIQAMPDGGEILIRIDKEDDCAVIEVSDTGIGISNENLKKLFSPFFTTKSTGNGFGLAEVDQVIRAHAGTIDVSSSLGHGTTFTIKLPLKPFGSD